MARLNGTMTRLNGTVARLPALELRGMGYIVQSQAGKSRGSIPLYTGATTENLHFLLIIELIPCLWLLNTMPRSRK